MKKKSILVNILLLILIFSLCFIITEAVFRIVLFSDVKIFKKLPFVLKQRNPAFYADPYSEDDYWKLLFRIEGIDNPRKRTSGPIKWVNQVIPIDTLKHLDYEKINDRRPVLLYGDSFARCSVVKPGCFEDILNSDDEFAAKHYLLNYGVGGYGLDQIYLLFSHSVEHYKSPLVVLSFMTQDIDRSILSFRGAQKPHFIIENNEMKLVNKPFNTELVEAYTDSNPQIISYFYRRILHSQFIRKLLPYKIISYLKKDNYYKEKKIQINKKIIIEIIEELKARDLNYVFLIFHPAYLPEGGSLIDNVPDWRSSFIKKVLDENVVPYIWSKDIIINKIKEENRPLSDFFIEDDGHPTPYLTGLIAEEIKKYTLMRQIGH